MQEMHILSTEEMQRRVQHWLDNGGREELTRVVAESKATAVRLREELRPDPEVMRQPMTI